MSEIENQDYENFRNSMSEIEMQLKWLFDRNIYQIKDLEIELQIKFKGKITFRDTLDKNEEFVNEIMRAIRNKKNPIEAFAILLNIGSKEIYSQKYREYLESYIANPKD